MIPTSDSYNPFPAFRRVGVALKFSVIDVDAKNTIIEKSAEKTTLGSVGATVDGNYSVPAKYATLERDFWALDGTFSIVPDDPGDTLGWWSDLLYTYAGRNSATLSFEFSKPVSSTGWSLYFDDRVNEYPHAVNITCYGADGEQSFLSSYSIESATEYIEQPVENYTKISFEFKKTRGNARRIRLLEVDFGLTEVWSADKIGSVTMVAGCDPAARAFPARECTFTFDNSKKVFDLLDPQGIYTYLQDGQTIDARLIIGGESVFMGDFWFEDVSVSSASVLTPTITSYDIVMRLEKQICATGDDSLVPLSTAVTWALGGTAATVAYGDGVAARTVRKSIPEKTTKREALRLFAQAARCTIYTDRYGVIQIREPVIGDVVGELTADELYSWAGVSVEAKVDRVELNAMPINAASTGAADYQYSAGAGDKVESFSNSCVAPSSGQAVADWLLAMCNWRKKFAVQNRCDPAVDILDTIRIHDIYGHTGASMVTAYNIEYSGGLSATTEAVGE